MMILLFSFSSLALSIGPRGHRRGQHMMDTEEFSYLRDIMHYAQQSGKKLENGVWLSLTSTDATISANIKKELSQKSEALKAYFKDIKVKVSEVKRGVELTLTSDQTALVQDLQFFGYRVVHHFLRDQAFLKLNPQGDSTYRRNCRGRAGDFKYRDDQEKRGFRHHRNGRKEGFQNDARTWN